jgi:hypothetical protein
LDPETEAKMRRIAALLLAASAGALIANSALACGESLFRVGRGVAFREYTAPLPGNILVVAKTDPELAMAERLAAAGHDVHVVADPRELGAEIAKSDHPFDLVLAYFDMRDVVEAQTTSTSVAFVPVALEGAQEEQAAKLYRHYLLDQDSVKHFLRTIHSVLRERV